MQNSINWLCLSGVSIMFALNYALAKPVLKNNKKQYETDTPLVVGWQDATSGQFPYMMTLEYYGATGWIPVCTMTLIKSYYALTAARCVATINVINLRGFAGILMSDNYTNTQQLSFNGIITHPDYNPYLSESYDIAIVRFSWPADTSRPDIGFIALPPDDSNDFVIPNCIAMGWVGSSADETFSSTLQWVEVPTIANDECNRMNIDSMTICTLTNPCANAGSPLVCPPIPGDTSPLYAVGILSYSTCPSEANLHGFYSRTSKYLDWIDDNTP